MIQTGVRPYRSGDEGALVAIFRDAVEQLTTPHYSAAQRAAWLARAPSAATLGALYTDGRTALVAERDGAPVGFSDVTADGHIRFLYVSPRASGLGVARALLGAVDTAARAANLTRIFSEASETALPVFLKCGYERVERRDFLIGDVEIHNYRVEKPIAR